MLEKTTKLPRSLNEMDIRLQTLAAKPSFENAEKVINSVIALLGIDSEAQWKLFTDSQRKIRSNARWFMVAQGFADKRAAYKIVDGNLQNVDLKAYWMKNLSKSITSWIVALTPNFEDEPFYKNLNVGIDFIIPEKADRVFVVLSKNYVIRTVELHQSLYVTHQEIFRKWISDFDYDNKAQVHSVLWDSFDLEPINKSFYKGISEFFVELKQFLAEDVKVFDDKHAAYFTNRLIGRIVFCWFLDKKGIINPDMQYFHIGDMDASQYYHKTLEILFFEVFNAPLEERIFKADQKTPFLNGGLFEIKGNDKSGDLSLVFPKGYFDRLYAFLHHYNFTTDESTASFQQVAIDPEMLGRIFENLLAEQVEETGEQARKAKGAFYTPREIVDYMCRESLREYLKTKIEEGELRDQRIGLLLDVKPHEFRDQQRNYRADLKLYKYDILKALDEIKIIDPACGSGAFPMGMLHILLDVYERLDSTFDAYKKKINIIKNNLFGVDIEPMAVEICRLRAWLSIIVDEESDSKKIEPLPNLDFKFICANSLIPLKGNDEKELFDTVNKDELIEIRDKYFNARTLKSKENLRKKFEKKIGYNDKQHRISSDREKQLRTYHPFDLENVSQFFDVEFMFGVKDGFDVVIGNPPYKQVKKGIFDKNSFPFSEGKDKGKQNLYKLFVEHSYNIVVPSGIACMIVQSSLLCDISSKFTREVLLTNTDLKKIVEFPQKSKTSSGQVFESVLQGTCVYLLKKKEPEKGSTFSISIENNSETINGLKFEIIHQDELLVMYPEGYFIPLLKAGGFKILRSLREKSIFLDELISNLQQGDLNLTTSKNYFGNVKTKIKLFRGKHIEAYSLSKDVEEYVSEGYKKESVDFNYENVQIVCQEVSGADFREKRLVCALTADGEYFLTGHTINKILLKQSDDNYLIVGLLNSKLLDWFFRRTSTNNHVGGYELRQLPISKNIFSKKNKVKKIKDLVCKIIKEKENSSSKNIFEQKRELNNLVFDLYELTPEERKIVLGDN